MNPIIRTVSLFALVTAVACKASGPTPLVDTDPVDDTDTDPPVDTDEPVDETAPTILSTTPADGAVGQPEDVSVTITFSEPMDPSTLETALDASDLGDVTVSWNSAGDTVTITPVEPLAYASGPGDDPTLEPLEYVVVLGTSITDLAGNPVEQGVQIQFSTYTERWLVFSPDPAMTRSLTPSELLFQSNDPLVVGDDTDDMGIRSVITFDLSFLPADAAEVTEATLATRQLPGDTWGTPWTDLGDEVRIDHVSFGPMVDENAINAAFNASQTALASHAGFAVEDQVVVQYDVTADVDDDVANRTSRSDRSQFLLYFDTPTDLDGANDRTVISRDLLELQVTYLAP